ncbi:hypothetical protein [Halobellus ordinarius]|uniref:hypothetical protein n=1 Tax=Halobellus ordinarius TaxID=3075120 RepID=UPI0028801A6F|nr:hypothetical protein [Halobellus sp. ZY16]
MATKTTNDRSSTKSPEFDVYLPAMPISSTLSSVESFLGKHLGRHGRVLIPDSYNK